MEVGDLGAAELYPLMMTWHLDLPYAGGQHPHVVYHSHDVAGDHGHLGLSGNHVHDHDHLDFLGNHGLTGDLGSGQGLVDGQGSYFGDMEGAAGGSYSCLHDRHDNHCKPDLCRDGVCQTNT